MKLHLALICALSVAAISPAYADEPIPKKLCIFDPAGVNGSIFTMMKDYQLEALKWGIKFEMKPYTDEKTAADDFKAGQCDAALITGTRVRPFIPFGGTLEAMGALPDYGLVQGLLKFLSKPTSAKALESGDYALAGLFPGGKVFLYVRDKNINSVEALAGKKLATMSFDDAAKTMVRKVGASLVAADVGTFAGMFNNGNVDACYGPAFVYNALELYKGIGDKGGVIHYPLAQLSLQLIVRKKDFSEDFLAKSRAAALAGYDRAMGAVGNAEKDIPEKHWIEISDEDRARYDQMFLDVRVELRDNKVYDGNALRLMRQARCKKDATRAECAQPRE